MDEVDWTVVYIYRNYGCGIGNVFLFDDAMFPHICCTLQIQEKIEEDNFNGHNVAWLSPIMEGLRREMKKMLKIWGIRDSSVKVINEQIALRLGLIKACVAAGAGTHI